MAIALLAATMLLLAFYFFSRDGADDSALAAPRDASNGGAKPTTPNAPANPATEAPASSTSTESTKPTPTEPATATTPPEVAPPAAPQPDPNARALRALDRDLADATTVDLATLADLATEELRTAPDGAKLAAALERFLAATTQPERAPAASELVASGRSALPFVIDAWKRLDLGTAAGRASAAAVERELVAPLAGASFGWKDDEASESVLFDRKVIAQWHRLAASAEAWSGLTGSASR